MNENPYHPSAAQPNGDIEPRRSILPWKFLLAVFGVAFVNVGAWIVVICFSGFPFGPGIMSPSGRLVHDTLGPPSEALLKPHLALHQYAKVTSPLIVLVEAAMVHGVVKLISLGFRRGATWRDASK